MEKATEAVGYRPKVLFDIIRLRRWWFLGSFLVIGAGIFCLALNKVQTGMVLNFGVDFTGGALHQYHLPKPVPRKEAVKVIARVRKALRPLGLAGAQITIAERRILMIRTRAQTPEELKEEPLRILKALQKELGQGVQWWGTDSVGPVIGAELRRKGLTAFILGCIGILFWVMIRYDFRFAVAGILALVHDALVVIGGFAILQHFLQIQINSEFVAALLTILGYSINDSVVIFDRIRENVRLRPGADFSKVANESLWQTMVRSINTSLTTLFVVLALLLLGGPPIRDFCLALLLGIIAGTYSSIFIAAPLVAGWREWAVRRGKVPAAIPPPAPKPQPEPVVPEAAEPAAPEPVRERRREEEAPAFTRQVRLVVTAPSTGKSKPKGKKKGKKRKRKKRY